MSTTTINLGSVEKIALGQGRCYLVGEEEIAVFRQRDIIAKVRQPARDDSAGGGVFIHHQQPQAPGRSALFHRLCPLRPADAVAFPELHDVPPLATAQHRIGAQRNG